MPPPTNAQIRSINLDGSDAQILVIMLRIAADYEELVIRMLDHEQTERNVRSFHGASPLGSSRWNRLAANLEKFIGNLNGCLGNYARSSCNYKVIKGYGTGQVN